MTAFATDDPEVRLLREERDGLARRVAAGELSPAAALEALWLTVDAYNARRWPGVRNWGRR